MRDSIYAGYNSFKYMPGALEQLLGKYHKLTENAYATFRDVVVSHSDIGKFAIIFMVRDQAAQLLKIACDESKDQYIKVFEMGRVIAPMFEMFYDRLTKEIIEGIDDGLEENISTQP